MPLAWCATSSQVERQRALEARTAHLSPQERKEARIVDWIKGGNPWADQGFVPMSETQGSREYVSSRDTGRYGEMRGDAGMRQAISHVAGGQPQGSRGDPVLGGGSYGGGYGGGMGGGASELDELRGLFSSGPPSARHRQQQQPPQQQPPQQQFARLGHQAQPRYAYGPPQAQR